MSTITAKLNYLKMAPRKVRLVAYALKGLPAIEAEAQLLIRNKRASLPLLKLLRSAVSNAKNKNLDLSKLFISKITVDQGPILKRFLPRAQGKATSIHKKLSHITLALSEASQSYSVKFNIVPKEKKTKKEKIKKSKKTATPSVKQSAEIKGKTAESTPGFFRKIFRRKSV